MARRRLLATIGTYGLVLTFLLTSIQSSLLNAAMVSSADLVNQELQLQKRADISAYLTRDDAQNALLALGVNPEQVHDRVQHMTDSELQAFQQQLESQQAGGTSVLGVIVVVFFLLIVLDLLGTTDIFPAVKPINQ